MPAKMPIQFMIQAYRADGGHGILTGFGVGLDGTHGIQCFCSYFQACIIYFGSEGGVGVFEGGEGMGHVFVVGGEVGVGVIILHNPKAVVCWVCL